MKIKKILPIVLALAMVSSSFCYATNADGQTQDKKIITKKQIATSQQKDFKSKFDDEITVGETKYKLATVENKILSEKNDEKLVTKTFNLTNLIANDKSLVAQTQIVDNVLYKLKDVAFTTSTQETNAKTLTAKTFLDEQTSKPTFDKTKNVSYFDEAEKINKTATIPLISTEKTKENYWKSGINMPIKISVYNAKMYKINNTYIPYNAQKPAFKGYENELLSYCKVSKESHKIDGMEWSGAIYKENNVQYRNAIVNVSRLQSDYVANYAGTINIDGLQRYNAVATYQANVKDKAKATYEIESTATYKPIAVVVKEIKKEELIQPTKTPLAKPVQMPVATKIIIATGSLLLCIGATITIFYLTKNKKSKQK
ncbi:MAG: hypothetical protein RSA79_00045 [Oscillospiraceae bacterium]